MAATVTQNAGRDGVPAIQWRSNVFRVRGGELQWSPWDFTGRGALRRWRREEVSGVSAVPLEDRAGRSLRAVLVLRLHDGREQRLIDGGPQRELENVARRLTAALAGAPLPADADPAGSLLAQEPAPAAGKVWLSRTRHADGGVTLRLRPAAGERVSVQIGAGCLTVLGLCIAIGVGDVLLSLRPVVWWSSPAFLSVAAPLVAAAAAWIGRWQLRRQLWLAAQPTLFQVGPRELATWIGEDPTSRRAARRAWDRSSVRDFVIRHPPKGAHYLAMKLRDDSGGGNGDDDGRNEAMLLRGRDDAEMTAAIVALRDALGMPQRDAAAVAWLAEAPPDPATEPQATAVAAPAPDGAADRAAAPPDRAAPAPNPMAGSPQVTQLPPPPRSVGPMLQYEVEPTDGPIVQRVPGQLRVLVPPLPLRSAAWAHVSVAILAAAFVTLLASGLEQAGVIAPPVALLLPVAAVLVVAARLATLTSRVTTIEVDTERLTLSTRSLWGARRKSWPAAAVREIRLAGGFGVWTLRATLNNPAEVVLARFPDRESAESAAAQVRPALGFPPD